MTISNAYRCIKKLSPVWRSSFDAFKMTNLPLSVVMTLSVALWTCDINAQVSTRPVTSAPTGLQAKVKAFLEPESGLNSEIRAGLARLEQTCTFTNKAKSDTPGPLFSKSALVPKEVAAARTVAMEQQAVVDKAISEFRSTHNLNMNACSALPNLLRLTDACARYQANSETAQVVSNASQTYFGETLARFKSYEAAVDLEARGCTRPDFAYKLWVAEQVHIVPKLKNSGQQLTELLK